MPARSRMVCGVSVPPPICTMVLGCLLFLPSFSLFCSSFGSAPAGSLATGLFTDTFTGSFTWILTCWSPHSPLLLPQEVELSVSAKSSLLPTADPGQCARSELDPEGGAEAPDAPFYFTHPKAPLMQSTLCR